MPEPVAVPASPAPAAAPAAPAAIEGDEPSLVSTAQPPAAGAGSDTPAATDDAAGEEGKDKPQAQPGAPAEFADFAIPEGTEFGSEGQAEYKSFARELGLTQEQAQKLVNKSFESLKAQEEKMSKDFKAQREAWQAETKQALGAKWQEEMSYAAKFIEKFGSPKLKELLNATGMGDHLELAKAFIAAGKAISEDVLVAGRTAAPAQSLTPQQVLEKNTKA